MGLVVCKFMRTLALHWRCLFIGRSLPCSLLVRAFLTSILVITALSEAYTAQDGKAYRYTSTSQRKQAFTSRLYKGTPKDWPRPNCAGKSLDIYV